MVFLALALFSAHVFANNSQFVDTTQAQNYRGSVITVCDFAYQVVEKTQFSYVNFDREFPNHSFTLFITEKNNYPNLKQYEKRNICAKGRIGIYKGKAEITNPKNIVIVD